MDNKTKILSLFEERFYESFKEMLTETSKREEKKNEDAKNKRRAVIKWLDSAQELHSVLAYRLWPNRDHDSARSIFSKKYRGEDADGKRYSFNEREITKLFNMMHKYINKISGK